RLLVVRRLFRCLSGPDRHPGGPRPSPWPGRPPVGGESPGPDARTGVIRPGRLGPPDAAEARAGRAGSRPGWADSREARHVAPDPRSRPDRRLVPGPGHAAARPGIVSGMVAADWRWTGRADVTGAGPGAAREAVLERIRAALA